MIKVETVIYHQAAPQIKDAIKDFLQVIWPSVQNDLEAHRKELEVRSFYIMEDERILSYAAIIQLEATIDNEVFKIGGLSCVATLPLFTRQGLGSKVVATATSWMAENLDFGVFTCKSKLAGFYNRAGNWKVVPKVILIANHDIDALSSDKLEVVVMMRLFSKKTLLFQDSLINSKIYLGFSKGQFI